MYKKSKYLLFAIVVHTEIADLLNECELVLEMSCLSMMSSNFCGIVCEKFRIYRGASHSHVGAFD